MKHFSLLILCSLLVLTICPVANSADTPSAFKGEIKVGWIGAMTGPGASYGAYDAVQIAVDEINATGGISGKKMSIIAEDGQCNSKAAVSAVQKLISVDKVKYILGGHCTPETLPITSIAEQNKVILLAAITSTPLLPRPREYMFRITSISLAVADSLSEYSRNVLQAKSAATIYEETDFAVPVAEHFNKRFAELGGEVLFSQSFQPKETDFRTLLVRIAAKKPEVIYLGVQVKDTADLILKQLKDLKINIQILGNDVVGNAYKGSNDPSLYEGLLLAEVDFDESRPRTKSFIEAYKKRTGANDLPFPYTAEAYDTPFVLKSAIETCGEGIDEVKTCLRKVKDFDGAIGQITINEFNDGVRNFSVKQIVNGEKVSPKRATTK
jgi:branched-chain amino acid transport system substrate-binding protein